jgi:hypothetical protein
VGTPDIEIVFAIEDRRSFLRVARTSSGLELSVRDQFDSDGYEATSVRLRFDLDQAASLPAMNPDEEYKAQLTCADGRLDLMHRPDALVVTVSATSGASVTWPLAAGQGAELVSALRESR